MISFNEKSLWNWRTLHPSHRDEVALNWRIENEFLYALLEIFVVGSEDYQIILSILWSWRSHVSPKLSCNTGQLWALKPGSAFSSNCVGAMSRGNRWLMGFSGRVLEFLGPFPPTGVNSSTNRIITSLPVHFTGLTSAWLLPRRIFSPFSCPQSEFPMYFHGLTPIAPSTRDKALWSVKRQFSVHHKNDWLLVDLFE